MIRAATLQDVDAIAELIVQAMGKLAYQFRNSEDKSKAVQLIADFVAKEGNQYSLSNILVAEINEVVVGAINAYDGAKIMALRKPFFTYLTKHYHPNGFEMEPESEAGEFYIDTLSVDPAYQGKGIGKILIEAAVVWAKKLGHAQIGLLVNVENPSAKRLYEKLGFQTVNQKFLLGITHDHLVFLL